MAEQEQLQKNASTTVADTQNSSEYLESRAFAPVVKSRTGSSEQPTPPNIQTKANSSPRIGHSFANLMIQAPAASVVQPKLTIGEPGDKYEQEADNVAAQVVQKINSPAVSSKNQKSVQRQQASEEEELQMKPVADVIQRVKTSEEEELQMKSAADSGRNASADLESSINQARGGGQSLNDSIRQPMEQAFGADFSGVKVHTDGKSDQLNQSIQAKAFTTGEDIFFRQGEYNPGNKGGQELLAHELTHVVQQNGSKVQTKIQRTEADGKPDKLNARLSYSSFKQATYLRLSKRGENLETIDKWLQALNSAQTWEEQQENLKQVIDACEFWLEKHGKTQNKKEYSSITYRRPAIQQIFQLARKQIGSNHSYQQTGQAIKGTRHMGGRIKEIGEGITESLGNIGGGAGSYDDVNNTNASDSVKSDAFGTTGIIEGVKGIYDGYKEYKEADGTREKIEAGSNILQGGGQFSAGVMSGIKAAGGDKFNAIGELGGAIGDGTAAIAGLISNVNQLIDFDADWKESTSQEKAASALDITGNIVSTGQTGVNFASGFIKTNAAFAGKEAASQTVSSLGSISAILGIITGSIQVAQGGFGIYRAACANNKIEEAQAQQKLIILTVSDNLKQVKEGLRPLNKRKNKNEVSQIKTELKKLHATLKQLQQLQVQSSVGMEAMKKVQNRRMAEGKMKAAGGTLSVVSSALVLSGAGAPIAIAIGALSGLLALGYAGLNLARNRKAGTLTTIAKRLSDDGKPKAKPDPEEPDYRKMEGRIYKCYYNHLPEVINQTQPAGMSSGEFIHVKEFNWEVKKKRVKSLDKHIISDIGHAAKLDEITKKNKWIEVQDSSGKATHKEKPKGTAKLGFLLSASAHKSKQSLMTSKTELANILTALCVQSYDHTQGKFINSPVVPVGNADAKTLEEFSNITLNTLLSAADITAARWSGWYSKENGNPDKLKQKVLDHIS